MDARKVISLLEGYREINSESLSELAKWKKEYPWFSALHTLEAKCLHNDKKFGLKKALKCASLYSGDREQLYDFMHDIVEFESQSISAPKVTAPEPTFTEKEAEPGVETLEASIEQSEGIEIIESKAKIDVPVPELVKDIVKDVEKTIEEVVSTDEQVLEESESRNEDVSSDESVDESQEAKDTPQIVYDPLKELQSLIEDDAVEELEKAPPTPVYDPLTELPKLAKEQETEPDRQDFLSWLDSMDHEEEPTAPKPRKLQMTEEAAKLLDNFIKNRPRIPRIRTDIDRTEVYQPNDSNPESKLVSESLANLHLKQGRPEKAIEILDILRLQNPEKMTYFAALIEKIKKEHSIDS